MSFKQTTLGEYAKVQGGYAYKSSDFAEGEGCIVLKIKNVRFGHVDYSEPSYIDQQLADETKEWKTKEGDILISMTGSGPNAPQSLVGRVARVWKDEPSAWINQRVGRVVLKDVTSIHPDFLFYLLSTSKSQDFLVSNSSGSANQANISGKIIESLPCPKVDFQTSARIAEILRSLDEKILLNRQINQTLEQIAQAIFKSWFVDFEPTRAKIAAKEAGGDQATIEQAAMCAISGKTSDQLKQSPPETLAQLKATAALFPDALVDSALGEIPEGWGVKSLSGIANYLNGLALQKFRPENGEASIPVLKIAQLKKGVADGEERATANIKPEYIVENGDVVFSWSGSLEVDFWCGGKVALNQHLFKVTSESVPKWFYYFWTKQHLESFQQIAADKAVTMGHIKRSHLDEAKCLIPNFDLFGFSTIENIIYKQIELRIENFSLTRIRDELLPKLLSGEIETN